MPDRITLTKDEAEELYRYLEHQYLSSKHYPALSKLWPRLSAALEKQKHLLSMATQ